MVWSNKVGIMVNIVVSIMVHSWSVVDLSIVVGIDVVALISMSMEVWILMMDSVVHGVVIWVVEVVVILHPLVSVNELMLIIIESVVVLLGF